MEMWLGNVNQIYWAQRRHHLDQSQQCIFLCWSAYSADVLEHISGCKRIVPPVTLYALGLNTLVYPTPSRISSIWLHPKEPVNIPAVWKDPASWIDHKLASLSRSRSSRMSMLNAAPDVRARREYLHFVKTATVPIPPYVTTMDFYDIANMHMQIVKEGVHNPYVVPHRNKNWMDFFLSFGVILFSFGGASTFPTIQNDMADRSKFKTSVYIAFAVILVLYLPIAFASYFVFGDYTDPNIILSLGDGPNVICANVFMAVHLIMAFLIIVNPVCQDIENIFNVPHEFGIWRCVVRTVLVLLMVVVGESIPQFSKILALVGGSTITLLTFILPNYMYMALCDQESPAWTKRQIPVHMRVYMWEMILIGVVGGVAATYTAMHAIFSSHLSTPCYICLEQIDNRVSQKTIPGTVTLVLDYKLSPNKLESGVLICT
ncbi:unnamed protein product, partial [Nesidiocoris tenuis]